MRNSSILKIEYYKNTIIIILGSSNSQGSDSTSGSDSNSNSGGGMLQKKQFLYLYIDFSEYFLLDILNKWWMFSKKNN